MKKFITNLSLIIGGYVCLKLASMTGNGEILNYINFADPLNEMAFFILISLSGMSCIIAAASKA